MSDKFCCVTYQELAPELISAKEAEIDVLISDKGLPRSVFASVLKVLSSMINYCPVCGSSFNATDAQVYKAPPKKQVEVTKSLPRKKCERCGGKAVLGHEGKDNYLGSGINIKCMNCHGKGWVDGRESVHETAEEKAHEEVVEKRIADFEAQGDANGN